MCTRGAENAGKAARRTSKGPTQNAARRCMPKGVSVSFFSAACRKMLCRTTTRFEVSKQAHSRFCAAFHLVVVVTIFVRQALRRRLIRPLQAAYLQAIGGQPSVSVSLWMPLDPSLLATMHMSYNIQASLQRVSGISSDSNTPADAALSLCSDVSLVIQGSSSMRFSGLSRIAMEIKRNGLRCKLS